MIDIRVSPELCYVLWVVWLFITFLMYSIFTLSVYFFAKEKRWGWLCVYVILHLVGIYNVTTAVSRISVWYNILAQLKGW